MPEPGAASREAPPEIRHAARHAGRQDQGFLLVEALVALAIIATMSTLVFLTIAQTSQSATLVIERRRALLLARSVLAAATVDSPAPPIADEGVDGPLAWRVRGEDYRAEAAGDLRLRQVTVTISERGRGRTLASLTGLQVRR